MKRKELNLEFINNKLYLLTDEEADKEKARTKYYISYPYDYEELKRGLKRLEHRKIKLSNKAEKTINDLITNKCNEVFVSIFDK